MLIKSCSANEYLSIFNCTIIGIGNFQLFVLVNSKDIFIQKKNEYITQHLLTIKIKTGLGLTLQFPLQVKTFKSLLQ